MPMNIHPQYITDDAGERISVILSIDEFNELLEQKMNQDLSHLSSQIIDGLNSPIIEQSHKEIFKELKNKYA